MGASGAQRTGGTYHNSGVLHSREAEIADHYFGIVFYGIIEQILRLFRRGQRNGQLRCGGPVLGVANMEKEGRKGRQRRTDS